MLPRLLFDQRPDEIVAVRDWEADAEFGVFPTGHKPKRALVCPAPAPHSFLRAGHRYLFKHPERHSAQQIWSEVIAYKLSKHLAIDVPPAFLAHDTRTGQSGVLIEFFFGYPGEPESRLVHASDRFQARGMPFDTKRGSLRDNIDLSRLHGVAERWHWWARTVAFDTLIGNTDRHSQNWGFLVSHGVDGRPAYSMAPAFDNGSSLGWLTRDEELARQTREPAFSRFIARGRHHFGWTAADDGTAQGHAWLAGQFVKLRPAIARSMQPIAQLTDSALENVLQECLRCTSFPVAFTAQRADFVRAQITSRRAALRQCLAG